MTVTGSDAGVVLTVTSPMIAYQAVSLRNDTLGLPRRTRRAVPTTRVPSPLDVLTPCKATGTVSSRTTAACTITRLVSCDAKGYLSGQVGAGTGTFPGAYDL